MSSWKMLFLVKPVSLVESRKDIFWGCFFFTIYVNDVILQFKENDPLILLYADDTVIYFAHRQLDRLQQKLVDGLQKLWNWCSLNKLTINLSKTKYEMFKPKCYRNVPIPKSMYRNRQCGVG